MKRGYEIRPVFADDVTRLAAADPRLADDEAYRRHIGALLEPGMSWAAERGGAVLGFAVSEVAGRFAGHTSAELDGDFEALLGMLRTAIEAEGASG